MVLVLLLVVRVGACAAGWCGFTCQASKCTNCKCKQNKAMSNMLACWYSCIFDSTSSKNLLKQTQAGPRTTHMGGQVVRQHGVQENREK